MTTARQDRAPALQERQDVGPVSSGDTFLFADVEGSTRLCDEHPDAMREALARHDTILRDRVEAPRGHVVKPLVTGCTRCAPPRTTHSSQQSTRSTRLSLRHLAPEIGRLRGRHSLNILGMEVLAAALGLEAVVFLSAPSPRLEAALHAEHRRWRHL